MECHCQTYDTYVAILKRELVCAMGCTEPIAIAYCAAVARKALGAMPERITVLASGNMIKNAKSVVVPNTDGRKGIPAAAALGVLAGNEEAGLQVVAEVTPEQKKQLAAYLDTTPIKTEGMATGHMLDITVNVWAGEHSARCHIVDEHTNVVLVEKDGVVLKEKEVAQNTGLDENAPDYTLLTVEGICDFADTCDLADVAETLERQIACNKAIAMEGLKNNYGANIGKTLLKVNPDTVRTRAKAWAAAGSDARMNGCEMPVVICSGSGNQGMTTSLPVIAYAEELGVSHEKLLRALLVSNLITIHEKTSIGRLSAYCGAVSAGAGAGCGIAYLQGGGVEAVSATIVNALAVTSGMVCDGAKASCAGKIATAVEAGMFGYEMYCNGNQYRGGDGLVREDVESSIANFGRLGRLGMKETDVEIIKMMTEE